MTASRTESATSRVCELYVSSVSHAVHPHLYRSVPQSGSFIRHSANIVYGVSFLSALAAKYVEIPHGTASLEKVTLGSSGGAIEVEAVGLDKVRSKLARLERLRQVSLDNELVSRADRPGDITATCPGERYRVFAIITHYSRRYG